MKKIFSFVLCLALLFTVIPTTGANAVNTEVLQEFNSAIKSGSSMAASYCGGAVSEYTADEKEVSLLDPSNANSQSNPYIIENANQMYVLMCGLCENNGVLIDTEGAYFKVADGIKAMYMNGGETLASMTTVEEIKGYFERTNVSSRKVWAESSKPFKGVFDGNGVVIYGIRSDNSAAGLFPYVASNATIKNVAVRNSYFSAVTAGGIIGDGNRGAAGAYTISNCEVSNCFIQNTRSDSGSGALAGYLYNTSMGKYIDLIVENCLVYNNTVTSTSGKVCTAIGGSFNSAGNLFKNSIFLGIAPFNTSAYNTKKADSYFNCYTDQNISNAGVNYNVNQLVKVTTVTGESVKTTMPNLDWQAVWAANAGIPILRIFHNIIAGSCDCDIEYFEEYCALYGHTLSSEVIENEVELTCTAAGSYDRVVYCTVCDKEVSRETIVTEPEGHMVQTTPSSSECYTVTNASSSKFSVSGGVYTSTNKSHNSSSTVTIRAVYDCEISLTYSVSSESNYDFLTIKHNGTQLAKISGSVSNSKKTVSMSSGDNITITYSKDISVNSGTDKGWFSFTCTPGVISVPAETMQPTCTEAVICTVCNAVVYDVLSHIPGEEMEENRIEATCTTNGSYDLATYCEVCDNEASRETIIIPALGHYVEIEDISYDCYTITNNSTYPFVYEDGVYTSTNKNHSSSSTIKITATSDCTIDLTFSVSSEGGWDYLTIMRNNTQIAQISGTVNNNTQTVSLSDGEYITVTYSKDGSVHSGTDQGWFSFTCVGTSSTIVPAEDLEASCNNPYICCVCGDYAIEQLTHTEGATQEENHIKPTSTQNGSYDEVIYCVVCGEELWRETIIVPKLQLDSDTVLFTVGDATSVPGGQITVPVSISNNPGITFAQISIEYDEAIFEVVSIDPLMFDGNLTTHSPTTRNPLLITFADCLKDSTQNGVLANITFKIKSTAPVGTYRLIVGGVQDNIFDVAFNDVPYTTVDAVITVNNCLHTYTYTAEENYISATCTEDGSYDSVVYCNMCEQELSRMTYVLYKTGHVFPSDTHPDVMPNPWEICYANSYTHTESCLYCYVTRDVTMYGGHDFADPVIEHYIEATCTEYGSYDEVVYCSWCGYEYSRFTVTIDPVGHDYYDEVIAPTCTAEGYTLHRCLTCDDIYSDDYVDALGHNVIIVRRQEPTFDSTGWTEGSYCDRCYEIFVEQIVIPALNEEISFSYEATGFNGSDVAVNSGYVTLDIYMNVNTDIARLHGWNFALSFDEHLTLENIVWGSAFQVNVFTPLDIANAENNVILLQNVGIAPDAEFTKGKYLLATLAFKVSDDYYNVDAAFRVSLSDCAFARDTKYINELYVDFGCDTYIYVEKAISGDVNNNNRIDNRDLALLLQYINGWNVDIIFAASDVNADGEVNNRDYALLLQYVNGWDVKLS